MATDQSATIVHLVQPKRPMTAAERARNYRFRQRQKKNGGAHLGISPPLSTLASPVPSTERPGPTALAITRQPRSFASYVMTVTAIGLAGVGLTMNGWFSKTLGSSDTAGWVFLAIGVAADLIALATPACAASLWQARQRGSATAAWAVWALSFVFVVTAGVGFASMNISDVTLARSSRVTPAIETAQKTLADAVTSRDRECANGVGKNCRVREEAVAEQRRVLVAAMASVQQTADPQTEAAVRIVSWATGGSVKPVATDFEMLRLILLALLPQVGGILLMIGRAS